jgi:hypothetical protein
MDANIAMTLLFDARDRPVAASQLSGPQGACQGHGIS